MSSLPMFEHCVLGLFMVRLGFAGWLGWVPCCHSCDAE